MKLSELQLRRLVRSLIQESSEFSEFGSKGIEGLKQELSDMPTSTKLTQKEKEEVQRKLQAQAEERARNLMKTMGFSPDKAKNLITKLADAAKEKAEEQEQKSKAAIQDAMNDFLNRDFKSHLKDLDSPEEREKTDAYKKSFSDQVKNFKLSFRKVNY